MTVAFFKKILSCALALSLVLSYFYLPLSYVATLAPEGLVKQAVEKIATFQQDFPRAYAATTTVIITSSTAPSGSCGANCWTVPAAWNDNANRIEVIGGGGGGDNDNSNKGSGGGGGGGYTSNENVNLTGNNNVTFAVGSGGGTNIDGGDTYICSETGSNCTSIDGTAVVAGAKGGTAGGDGTTVGVGGQSTAGRPITGTNLKRYSGGNGGAGNNSGDLGGGGGGAAGPGGGGGAGGANNGGGGGGGGNGSGGAAEAGNTDGAGQGGDGPDGTGGGATESASGTANTGGGGAYSDGPSSAGNGGTGNGTVSGWGAGVGAGGGGGGMCDDVSSATGGTGGLYGGGGGGGEPGGSGAQGIIVIRYEPIANQPPNAPTLQEPTDTATEVDVGPVLKMTATDTYFGDDISYRFAIHTSSCTGSLVLYKDQRSSVSWQGQDATCTADPTSCYASGTQGVYSIQAVDELGHNTTYYWWAAAYDPDGSASYSASSTCYSFTTEPDNPKIGTAQNERFVIGGDPVLAADITISDGAPAQVTAANDIRIAIATTSGFGMTWDSSVGTVSYTGSASGKVSTSVQYDGGDTVVILDVDPSDFSDSDFLVISGLKYANFTGPPYAGTGALTLYLGGVAWGLAAATSSCRFAIVGYDGMLRIGKPPNYLSTGNGLVAYYTFDGKNMYQNVSDLSGSGNTGYIIGQSSSGTTTAPGRVGQSLNFDGTDDYVSVTNAISNVRTVALWAKPRDSTETILELSGTANVQVSGGSLTSSGFNSPTYYVDGNATQTYPNDAGWHHVAVTDTADVNSTAIALGKVSTTYLTGSLDDVRFYSRALSAFEIASLYRAGTAKLNANQTVKMSTGLVAYYTFDGNDMYQNVVDSSGSGNTAYYLPGVAGNTSTTTVPGKLGQALDFDGGDDIATTTSDFISTGADSFVAWIKPTTLGEGNVGRILSNSQVIFYIGGTNAVSFSSNGGVTTANSANSVINFKQWAHVAATRAADGTANIYVNGILSGSANQSSGTPAAGGYVVVGNNGLTTATFNGDIDEVRIYNRVLSASEILQLYRLGTTRSRR